ncbi:MAG: NRDE family protein [Planctomycetota bacterium]
MCTLTLLHGPGQATEGAREGGAPAPSEVGRSISACDGEDHEVGYRVWFNRDERLTRGAEVPPAESVEAGVRYLAPTDSDADGTWIAVNEYGVTLALLNGYADAAAPDPVDPISRGQLVRSLSRLGSVDGLWPTSSPRALARYRPFVLVALDGAGASRVLRWNGRTAVVSTDAAREVPFISSSFAQDEVRVQRGAIYRDVVADPEAPTAAELGAYHRYVDPVSGPSAFTPSMRRDDASTRSHVEIAVTRDEVSMRYAAGAPHEAPLGPALVLPRR